MSLSFEIWCNRVEIILTEEFGITTDDVANEDRLRNWYEYHSASPMCFVNDMEIKYDLININ